MVLGAYNLDRFQRCGTPVERSCYAPQPWLRIMSRANELIVFECEAIIPVLHSISTQ